MKKFFKSVVKVLLTLGIVIGLVLMTAEHKNINMQFLWTMSWMAEMFICGWALTKLFPEEFKEDQI